MTGKNKSKDNIKSEQNAWGVFFKVISIIILACLIVSVSIIVINQLWMGKSFSKISIDAAKRSSVAVNTDVSNGCKCDKKEESSEDNNTVKVSDDGKNIEVITKSDCKCSEKAEDVQKGKSSDIDYIERLQEIQKEATASDITSLIYSIVITIITAVGTGLITKVFKSADEAKEAYKNAETIVGKVKKKLDQAVDSEKKAEELWMIAKKHAENAEVSANNASKAKESAERAAESAKKASESNKETNIQVNASIILRIQIEILYAKLALSGHDKTTANEQIDNIYKLVLNLNDSFEASLIGQLQTELLRLESSVDEYNREIAESDLSQARKDSAFTAVERYKNQIKSAIDYCDKLIEEAESAETV